MNVDHHNTEPFHAETAAPEDLLLMSQGYGKTRRIKVTHEQPQQRKSRKERFLGAIGLGRRISEEESGRILAEADTRFEFDEPQFLLDITRLGDNMSPLVLGHALPRVFGEQLDTLETAARLQELAQWLDPSLKGDIQEIYKDIHAIEQAYNEDIERQKRLAAEVLRHPIANRSQDIARQVYSDFEQTVSLARLYHQKDSHLRQAGLDDTKLSISTALLRVSSSDKFVMAFADEFRQLNELSDQRIIQDLSIKEAKKALRTIGETPELRKELMDLEEARSAILVTIRLQSLRICYLAMLYEQDRHIPVAGIENRDTTTERSADWQATINRIQQTIRPEMLTTLSLLAHQLVVALQDIPVTQNNDDLNHQIASYFESASQVASTDTRVDAIRQQLQARFGDYITLP